MPSKVYFDRKLFRFLKDLEANNNREWFAENKPRYQKEVRDPLLAFINDFGSRLTKLSLHMIADPKPSGGSMFRIYRDTRFAKDKSPYKLHASAQFRHEAGKDAHTPCFYLHLQPGECFVGAGIWHPDGPSTLRIRQTIVDHTAEWKRIVGSRAWQAACTLEGDFLKRPPRGFDPEHECIEDIKRKDFIAVARFKDSVACSDDFMNTFVKFCRTNTKLMQFLTQSLGVSW